MTEIKTNAIPHRLKNVSKEHPYVSGARDIYDDIKGKSQEQVNKDVDDTLALHQSEINALDSQNYVTVTADDQTTAVTDVLPEEGERNTVYRVGNWDGTQYDPTVYSEYAWNGSAYIFLDKKQYAIDDEPTAESENLVKSGGVFGAIEEVSSVIDGGHTVQETFTSQDVTCAEGIMIAGHSYTIDILNYNVSDIASDKGALWLKYTQNSTEKDLFILLGGEDLSGTTEEVTIPDDATNIYIIGKANHYISLKITDHTNVLEEIRTLNDDMYDREVSSFAEETQLYLNGSTFANVSTGHDGYLFPVIAGQRVVITQAINSPQCKCAFTTTKPALNKEAAFMTGSPVVYRTGVDYVCPSDGWCYFAKSYATVSEGATLYSSVTVDGVSVFLNGVIKGLITKVSDLNSEVYHLEENTKFGSIREVQSDAFDYESKWWAFNKFLDNIYAAGEEADITDLITRVQQRAGSGKYQIAVISDTHGSGAYSNQAITSNDAQTCFRSILAFNRVASVCDAALHGGDISCDYGTSRNRILQYMLETMRMFRFDKPFFITKGNHDVNYDVYIEADMQNLDWTNTTYYKREFSTFTQVASESAWRGEQLYISSQEQVSDKQFRNTVQHWLCPQNAVWGDGAYYYYDIDSVKIRFIVANSFPKNDDYTSSDASEYLWLAQTALDFSAKGADKSNWKVIILRHTQSTSIEELSNLINAFKNGSSWTYNETTVDFGTLNGGGMTFIAHIHGHEHENCFSNGSGYIDLGENKAFVDVSTELGNAKKYGLSVLTIDTVNSKIYEDEIGGDTLCYDYSTTKAELLVGGSVKAASSGLKNITVTSSDTSVAEIAGTSWVKGKAVGDATITVSGTLDDVATSFSYLISVVASY